MSTRKYRESIFRQALPLLSSHGSDAAVTLATLEASSDYLVDVNERNFHEYFLYRRLLGALPDLYKIIERVRISPSKRSLLVEEDVHKKLIGVLNIPRYVSQRVNGSALKNRSLPVLRSSYSYDTPENRFALSILKSIEKYLVSSPFPPSSSEGSAVRFQRRKVVNFENSPCFAGVGVSALSRLAVETSARVRRRRTGNDSAYSDLFEWYEKWNFQLGPTDDESEESLALSFPTSDSFWNKIFEVWCLIQCFHSLSRQGFSCNSIAPLHRTRDVAARFSRNEVEIVVHFQKSGPLGAGRWAYSGGKILRGIPDISLTSLGKSPLYVDAKFRDSSLSGNYRSEEIYKMLGYAENFNQNQIDKPFFGLLIFPSTDAHTYRVERSDNAYVDVIASPTDLSAIDSDLDSALASWIASPQVMDKP